MDIFIVLSRWLARNLNIVSGFCLVAMMLLSCMDIILRFMRTPISGAYELVSFCSAIMISFAMAQTTIYRAHVSVEVFIYKFPKIMQQGIFILTSTVMFLLLATLAFESFVYGNFFKQSGELSSTLQLPFYPILYGMGFAFIVSSFIPAIDIYMVLFRKKESWFQWGERI